MSTTATVDARLVDQARHEIRGLVHEIEELAKRDDLSVSEFCREFLARTVTALGAVGGVIWMRSNEGLRAEHQVGLSNEDLGDSPEERQRHSKLLQKVLTDSTPILSPPFSTTSDEDSAGNPTGHLLVLAPLKNGAESIGVAEIFHRPQAGAVTQRGYLRFLLQMADLAGNFLKSHKLRQFSDQQAVWQQWSHYARTVHASLDPRKTAFAIANEGRRLLGCDRVSVLVRRGHALHVACVSGQELFDARAGLIKRMERLARTVSATGDELWYEGESGNLAPQVEQTLHEYADEAHCKTLAVLPLKSPSPGKRNSSAASLGVLILEQFELRQTREQLAEKAAVVSEHGAAALHNALEHHNLWLLPMWKAVSRARWLVAARNLPKTALALGGLAALVVALAIVPADFNLEARGVLQPVERREVFASSDGVVMDVMARHGQVVAAGEVLAELKDADLDARLTALRGDYGGKQERLLAVRNILLGENKLNVSERTRLHGERKELEGALASIQEQLRIIEDKQRQLHVRSPMDGQVVTWNVFDLLIRRPVKRGDALMTVVDPHGEWELELRMPEERMGHLSWQMNRDERPLTVSYILATDPGVTRQGTIKEVHESAEVRGEDGNTVLVKVQIDKSGLSASRPGAEVTAKVNCGRRSIGYVWFHDLIAFVQSKILFRL